jgi:hypothetical protein
MRLTLPLLIGSAGAAVVTWTDASTAMSAMEDIVKRQSAELQAQYVSAKEAGSSTQTCGKNMCDTSSAGGTRSPQFLNRGAAVSANNTCSRLDLDVNGYIVTSNVGGRHVASRPTTYDTTSSGAVRCKYANELCPDDKTAYGGIRISNGQVAQPAGFGSTIQCVDNAESRADYLTRTGCVSTARKDKCFVNEGTYGFSRPDSAASLSAIGSFETCASEQLLTAGPAGYSIREVGARHPQTAWHFSGFQQTGLYRNWPHIYQCRTEHQCSGCSDPRFRGWYAGAASGPKDVVIIIDTSGSMQNAGRMKAAIEAAQWTVNTLSATDYATVVSFASTARTFGSSARLLPMTAANRKALKAYLASLQPSGATNMKAAFETAFGVIERSTTIGADTAGCNKIFLFLSDGAPTAGQEPEPTILARNGGRSYVNDNEEEKTLTHVRIFTFAFGSGAPSALMKSIACANSGIASKVSDADKANLKSTMASYFVYLAAGIKGAATTATASWTDTFEDGQGLGQLTGACSAAYDKTKDPVQLLAVLCLGLPIETAKTLTGWNAAFASAMTRRKTCPIVSFTLKQLEALRLASSPGGEAVCLDTSPGFSSGDENDEGVPPAIVGAVTVAAILFGVFRCIRNKQQQQGGAPTGRNPQAQLAHDNRAQVHAAAPQQQQQMQQQQMQQMPPSYLVPTQPMAQPAQMQMQMAQPVQMAQPAYGQAQVVVMAAPQKTM